MFNFDVYYPKKTKHTVGIAFDRCYDIGEVDIYHNDNHYAVFNVRAVLKGGFSAKDYTAYNLNVTNHEEKLINQVIQALHAIAKCVKYTIDKDNRIITYNNVEVSCFKDYMSKFSDKLIKENKNYVLKTLFTDTHFIDKFTRFVLFQLLQNKVGTFIIGITGNKRTGKSTLAEMLKKKFMKHTIINSSVQVLPLATPLKDAACSLLGVNHTQLEYLKNKEVYIPDAEITYRDFLQQLGTEFMQSIIGSHWAVHLLSKRIETFETSIAIIPDVRFDHEANFIKRSGGTMIKLNRDTGMGLDTHVSEKGVSDYLIDYSFNVSHLNDSNIIADTICKRFM